MGFKRFYIEITRFRGKRNRLTLIFGIKFGIESKFINLFI